MEQLTKMYREERIEQEQHKEQYEQHKEQYEEYKEQEQREQYKKAITPFLNKITLSDCFDILPQIPDHSIDLIFIDPPYYKVVNEEFDRQWRTMEEYQRFVEQLAIQFRRILKTNGSLLCFTDGNNNAYSQVIYDKYFDLLNLLIFYKTSGNHIRNIIINKGHFRFFCKSYESCLFYQTKESKIKYLNDYNGNMADCQQVDWNLNGIFKDGKIHPTQKPLSLVKELIQKTTRENDLILDCFSGSGTTALACCDLNRNFIAIEKDEKYYRLSVERLKRAMIQPRLL
jgi:site-specific DNA-methyltransferase (adenine-specific)